MAAQRRTVYFAGHVQGVGFRYTAASIARRYAITGFVQNLSDGRVVVLAEGQDGELDRYFADLADTMRGYIRDSQSQSGPASGEFSTFEVRL